jgi:hypothetical protein
VVEVLGSRFLLGQDAGESPQTALDQGLIQRIRKSTRAMAGKGWNYFEDVGSFHKLDSPEKAMIQFMQCLNIEIQKNSNILFVSHEAPSPH